MNLEDKDLKELFALVNQFGKKRYHKLTQEDFEDYRAFDYWRYVNGNSECSTTPESRAWVNAHSGSYCPICGESFYRRDGKSIDHKLPRSQYPWLSMEFRNFWVICRRCNIEKAEMHWYEYELFIFNRYPDRYATIRAARPSQLIRTLKTT